jgi:hypothetical protein
MGVFPFVFLGPQTARGYLGLIGIVNALWGFWPIPGRFGGGNCCGKDAR